MKIPIEVSARHIHLDKTDLDRLFGPNYQLTKLRNVSQPNQFAAKEVVKIKYNDKFIDNVRIVAPLRKSTQVEISKTDSIKLKMEVPIRISGDTNDTPGITIIGPYGEIILPKGVIIAKRHLHISPKDAKIINVKNGDIISIKIGGKRALVFNEIVVRSNEGVDELSFQLDADEANAADIIEESYGEIYER